MQPYKIQTNKTWDQTIGDLEETFRKWGVTHWRVDPMRPGQQRGELSRVDRRVNRTVTVSFTTADGEGVTLSMDTQPTRRENLRVLALALEDMRMIEKRGLDNVYRQRYGTALARVGVDLQQPTTVAGTALQRAYTTLGVQPGAPLDVAEAAYRALAKRYHPDATTGADTTERFTALNNAISTIRKERT